MMPTGEGLEGGRHVNIASYPDAKRAAAVSAFDARFGEMEQVLCGACR